jgi:hypothetical protein
MHEAKSGGPESTSAFARQGRFSDAVGLTERNLFNLDDVADAYMRLQKVAIH